jgi:hypothetical protein
MTDTMITFREHISERWRSTEPGLRWAYILSIIGALLSVISHPSYIMNIYRWMNSAIIPATLVAWIVGNLPFRLVWLGFMTLFTLSDISIIYGIFLLFGNFYFGRLFYISLVLVVFALVMGFRSINLEKASRLFLEKAPMRLFAVIYLLMILSYLIDLLLTNTYPPLTQYIGSSIITSSYAIQFLMVLLYILLVFSIERRRSFGIVLTPVLSIALVVPWLIMIFYRLNAEFLNLFYEELIRLHLGPLLRKLVIMKAIVNFIFPILLIAAIFYFFRRVWDTTPPKKSIVEGNE